MKTEFKTVKFQATDELLYNPYVGFTSFQHFRGEALYSDRISGKSGSAGCETEDYECYPIPSGVPENGRSEGWYPDTTVAYIRVLWREFEPERGKYNYKFIEDILEKARACGESVMFRLMPHSTCSRDDVPDWLREIIPCPERPDGMRVKDSPTDERFLKYFGEAIAEIGNRFDSDATLDVVDVCLPGAWGEGHKLENYSPESLKAFVDIYANNFKNTKLLGQIASPDILNYIREKRPIGFRGDGTGSPYHMTKYFPERMSEIKCELWKSAPVSFESYWWISEWDRQGWDLDLIIKHTLDWHISTFNTKSFPIPYKWQGKIEEWIKSMGYRFAVSEITHPVSLSRGESLTLKLKIENLGVAPIYNKLPLKIKLKSECFEYEKTTKVDIRRFLPGTSVRNVSLKMPESIPEGNYEILLAIGGGDYASVKLAMDSREGDNWYKLSRVEIK